MKPIIPAATAALLLLTSPGVQAEICRWKDSQGRTQYSDSPPPGVTCIGQLKVPKPAPAPTPASGDASKSAKSVQELDMEFKKRRQDKQEADRVLSQLKITIRTNYSNPPTHGGAIVAAVLGTPELRAQWEQELAEMRVRIKQMRHKLVDGLKAAGVKQDMGFITSQIGMFSYSGLSKDQMVRLRTEFGVYGTDTGRMCVAALNSKNIDYVCQAIAKVVS